MTSNEFFPLSLVEVKLLPHTSQISPLMSSQQIYFYFIIGSVRRTQTFLKVNWSLTVNEEITPRVFRWEYRWLGWSPWNSLGEEHYLPQKPCPVLEMKQRRWDFVTWGYLKPECSVCELLESEAHMGRPQGVRNFKILLIEYTCSRVYGFSDVQYVVLSTC